MANGRCRMHGGTQPIGPASPNYKHGRYSKILPEALRAGYEAALADPKLLHLDEEIALIDARIGQRLSGNPSSEAWGDLGKLIDRRQRLVESERKRLEEAGQLLTTEQAMALVAALIQIIHRHVTDRGMLSAITTEIRALTSIAHKPRTERDTTP